MARYIKANRKVAEFLKLENDRNTLKDGNYLLWQGDMLAFGPLTALPETLAQIGGIALQPHEAKEEQDGTTCRALPTATDARFVIASTTDADTDTDSAVEEEPTEEAAAAEPEPEADEVAGDDPQNEDPGTTAADEAADTNEVEEKEA
jgi:hypothetical protein